MSELFRSAMSYLSQVAPASSSSVSKADHPLVGSVVQVGGLRLRIRSLIAEGGFALVFSAQDSRGNWYALKRQLAADREAVEAVLREIRFLRELSGHPAIIRYVQAAQLGPQESDHGRAEFLLVTELCNGGSVIETLQKRSFSPKEVLKIFYAACSAVKHMHCHDPPISHRDIKIENLLFDSAGSVKLCDFGSATTDTYAPDESWSVAKRAELEEELARHTTPMYRSPELVDMFSNFPIGPAQDIWALGCILFYLCYRTHPFEDSAKLRIINAKYTLPEVDTGYNMFHAIIKGTLQVDPRQRPTINTLCDDLESLAITMSFDLNFSHNQINHTHDAAGRTSNVNMPGTSASSVDGTTKLAPPPRPPPPSIASKTENEFSAHQQASAMLDAIKGQGISWFKNIKDKTTAVAQTVQSTYGGKGPDVTFVTSRLVVCPLVEGVPETLAYQAEEAIRASILEKRKGKFAVYNLSQRRLRCDYCNRLSETPFPPLASGLTPTLKLLINLCRNMLLFLQQDATNFIVIMGPDAQCALLAIALLLYTRFICKPSSGMELLRSVRSCPILSPSYLRQLDMIAMITETSYEEINSMAHNRTVIIDSILFSPVPLFNRARSGCRPFVEVYCGGSKLWSMPKEFDQLKVFEQAHDPVVELNLGNLFVSEEVQVVVFHARWSKIQNRIQLIFMFSFTFHSNFIDTNTHQLEMSLRDIDRLPEDENRFEEHFRVGLTVIIGDSDRGFNRNDPPVFLSFNPRSVPQAVVTSDQNEYDELHHRIEWNEAPSSSELCGYKCTEESRLSSVRQGRNRGDDIKSASRADDSHEFFDTLEWNDSIHLNHPQVQATVVRVNVGDSASEKELRKENLKTAPHQESVAPKHLVDKAEAYEQMYGIRVSQTAPSDEDADQYKFDYEKKPKEGVPPRIETEGERTLTSDFDLLGLGTEMHEIQLSPLLVRDPQTCVLGTNDIGVLSNFEDTANTDGNVRLTSSGYLIDSITTPPANDAWLSSRFKDSCEAGIQRNVSAPSFASETKAFEVRFDPFADFMNTTSDVSIKSRSHNSSNANLNEGPTGVNGRTSVPPSRPNYSRAHFDAISSMGGPKLKLTEDTFNDLLSSQGFSVSSKGPRSIGEMKRKDEIEKCDPVTAKIRSWTYGKEKNIRALLGSLNDVLWPDADRWDQPGMGDLLTASQVKKYYRKACLTVHPDKQLGSENETLARAIFTELNDAWTAFEEAGSPSLQ